MADPDGARDEARRILEGDRYQARDVPRPLRGVLEWLGDRLRAVAEPLGELLSTPAGLAATLTVAVLASGALAVAVARRRNRTHARGEQRRRRTGRADPAALDRRADEAEAQGDLAGAVRLRFRAGVLRLEEAGALPVRADTTTRRVVDAVPVAPLPDLARTFDEVAYGRRPARPADADAARRGWPEVLARAQGQAGASAEAAP